MMAGLDPRTWCWSFLMKHPLFIALVQLGVGLVAAYFLTERWQRWRQRREFQYRLMSKLSETSTELFVLLADMLTMRARPVEPELVKTRMVELQEKQRTYIIRRTAFHALEAEVMASFTRAETMSGYYALNDQAKVLFDLVQASALPAPAVYEPAQNEFRRRQKTLLGQMVVEMKLLPWRDRRELRKDPAWQIES